MIAPGAYNLLTMATILSPLNIVVSGLGMAMVFLGVVAVFGHSGKTEMSPRRRIAIATGQKDRHTVFESSILGPLMWVLVALTEKLAAPGAKKKLRATIIAAGSPNFYTAEELLALGILWGLIAGTGLGVLNLLAFGSFSYAALVIGFAAGIAGTLYYMREKAARRVREISRRVPYTLDLVALAMGAGSTFVEATKTVIRESPEDPLNQEFNTMLAEIDLGTTRRQALVNLAERIPLDSLRSIVASIIQAEELGTPLSDSLASQSSLLRMQRSVRAEKLAATASVRILIPSVLILLSVVLTLFAPFIVRAIRRELF